MDTDTHTTVSVHRDTHERLKDAQLHESMSLDGVINVALDQSDLDEYETEG